MKGKLSFAQRLVRESNSNEHSALHTPTSCEKKPPLPSHPHKNPYMQFKQHHSELQTMLKLFDHKRQPHSHLPTPPPPAPTPAPTAARTLPSAVVTRKLDRNNQVKRLIPFAAIEKEVLKSKQKVEDCKMVVSNRQDFKSFNSVVVPRTNATNSVQHSTTRTQKLRKQQTESKMMASTEEAEPTLPLREARRKSQSGKGKRGIPNIGNTCYINALVQCLFHLPHFNDYFAEQLYLAERNGRSQDVVELYRALYLAVMRTGSQEISTLPLKKSVSKICSLFIDWEQEDAHEFMKELLNSMHEDLNRAKGKPNYKQLGRQVEGHPLPATAAAYWDHYKLRDDSYIYDSLCGQLYNNIKCINCQHESQTFQNFLDLSLPIVPPASSLQDLLDSFFSPEKLADFYTCEQCSRTSKKSTKTVELWRVPRFLIIQLKRSQFGKKNTEPITIPQSLSLRKFMGQSNDRSAKYCQYSLSGAVMHRGVLEGGHYWCNVKEGGQWFEIDDDKTAQLDSEVLKRELTKTGSASAYILFYSSLYC